MHDLNKAIVEKIKFWSNTDIVNHWVGDVVTEKAHHGLQLKALQNFWQILIVDGESNKLYLLQQTLVILTFSDQLNIVLNTNDLHGAIQELDSSLRSHIKLNLLQAFPQARDTHSLTKLSFIKPASFKEYWSKTFDLITLIVLLDASMQSELLLNTAGSGTKEYELLIRYAKMLRGISDYFNILSVVEQYDVMDDVALVSTLLRDIEPDKGLCARFTMDAEAIEETPEQRMRLVFSVIQQAYSKMGDYFPDYHVLGDGYRINNELHQAMQIHQQTVKSRLAIFNGTDASSFGFLKTFWSRLGAPVDKDKQLKDEYDFIDKILFLNQQGCLNLKLLAQIQNKYVTVFLHCDPKTNTFYTNIKDNLSEQLARRSKMSKNSPSLAMRPDNPLMKSLQQQSKARAIQAPPQLKKTPPVSPSMSAKSTAIFLSDAEAEGENTAAALLHEKDCEQLYGTPLDKLDEHQHSRACGNAQKHYFVDWVYMQFLNGTFQLNQMDKERQSLCCVYWKYNTKDYFKSRSNIYATEQQVRSYVKEELALLAGAEGEEEAKNARERHESMRKSTVAK
ncbi:MAG: hypothetical protein WC748_08540 [Legionellales bacterium]|jgi:hypothetical protein